MELNKDMAKDIQREPAPAEASPAPDARAEEPANVSEIRIINNIYALRTNFLIIGLTGRTGSGCTAVADILTQDDIDNPRPNHQLFRNGAIDNQARKDRIVYNFIKDNWAPFVKITASDIIYFFAFQQPVDEFINQIYQVRLSDKHKEDPGFLAELNNAITEDIKAEYNNLSPRIKELAECINNRGYASCTEEQLKEYSSIFLDEIPALRHKIESCIREVRTDVVPRMLQTWGNHIRSYKSIVRGELIPDAPEAIAFVINGAIKILRKLGGKNAQLRIVIDALRNPFEILYFRERYASFYCMSVNTDKSIRHDKLLKEKKLNMDDILHIDENEGVKKDVKDAFCKIDLDKCIELSDIHLSHDGTPINRNFDLINQITTYVSLMLHPGLVTPTPLERMMQIAYTAKLNSGCLSRQVGAAVTDADFSLKAIGWNSVPTGQVPCSLRQFDDLCRCEDTDAFSSHELNDAKFQGSIQRLKDAYSDGVRKNLQGVPLTYCFKNIHTRIEKNQAHNQVHTRSLHAEENAFLQIAKYGGNGLTGGKLFTTASCCELCSKKAYQLGIKEIYYIDTYPGISNEHILQCGTKENRPRMILFHGAVGRAYMNLYNPFLPLKDEIEVRTAVNVGETVNPIKESKNQAK